MKGFTGLGVEIFDPSNFLTAIANGPSIKKYRSKAARIVQRTRERRHDSVVILNLGVAYGALGRGPEAERYFRQALAIAPGQPDPPLYYARWLESKHRLAEAQE